MTKNIYELLKDNSAAAEQLIWDWSKRGVWRSKGNRTPRERLALMANTLKGEEIVRDYLNEHIKGSHWIFTDDKRTEISNDYYWPKLLPDLLDCASAETCEIKEFHDKWFVDFGEQVEFGFIFDHDDVYDFRHDVRHNANNCIVINTSHTKIAQLDLKTLRYNAKGQMYYIKAMKVVELGGNK